MISNHNKELNRKLNDLIKSKNSMTSQEYIKKMKSIKNEIDSSMIDSVNHEYSKESIIDQVKGILHFKIK